MTVTLRAVSTRFWSPGDEQAFFDWLRAIGCVTSFGGKGYDLDMVVDPAKINDDWLRELLALFIRYDVDLRQLAQFLTAENKTWFANPRAAWHAKIFG